MTDNAPTTPASATLDCPNCQTTITYYDVAGSSFYACPNCHSYFEYEHEGPPRVIRQFSPTKDAQPLIPPGSEGTLGGNLYRVVGFMRKTEAGSSAEWREYVLFSPVAGYAQLAEYNGHWQFIRLAEQSSYTIYKGSARSWSIHADERHYQLYHKYQPRLLYAVGEFDYNVLDDEQLTIREFISPPYMLVQESRNRNDTSWYQSEHRPREAVADAFGLPVDNLPQPYGIGAVQPAKSAAHWNSLVMLTIYACLAVLLLIFIFYGVRSSPTLLQESFYSERDTTKGADSLPAYSIRPFISKSFEVNGPTALAIDLKSSVTNQWVELAVDVVNEQTGKTYEFTKNIEYYAGIEEGERWSEGDREESAVLSRVPSGRYHLVVQPYAENLMPASVAIKVQQNTTLHSNILLTLMALLVYPFIVFWQNQNFETQRWAESNYGAQYGDDE